VLLGGFYAGDQATLFLPETLGVHMLAIDWPWRGPRRLRTSQFVRLSPDIYQMLMQSPAVLALGVDAVLRQPEVDPSRIALIGASLGVPSTVAALELTQAPTACALVYGGADVQAWMRHELPRHIWPGALAPPLASVLFDFVRPLEPSLHREAAARARFLILNARDDQTVPPEVAEALHHALPQATVRWKDGRHISSSRNAQLDGIAAEVEAWLESQPSDPE
jgi:predicted alpha/beta hydrolase family esterase